MGMALWGLIGGSSMAMGDSVRGEMVVPVCACLYAAPACTLFERCEVVAQRNDILWFSTLGFSLPSEFFIRYKTYVITETLGMLSTLIKTAYLSRDSKRVIVRIPFVEMTFCYEGGVVLEASTKNIGCCCPITFQSIPLCIRFM